MEDQKPSHVPPSTVTTHNIRESTRRFNEFFEDYAQYQSNMLENQHSVHNQHMERGGDSVQQLKDDEERLKKHISDQHIKAGLESDTVLDYQKNLEELRNQIQVMPLDIQLLEIKQNELQKEIMQKNKSLDIKKREKEMQLNALSKAISVFSNNLGLDFEVVDGTLCISMRKVDVQNPDRMLSFKLAVDDNSNYQVKSCDPKIPEMDILVKQLNKNEELSWYVDVVCWVCGCGYVYMCPLEVT